MNFKDYQKLSRKTAIYPSKMKSGIIYPALGLGGEAGEVLEKVKKLIRDKKMKVDGEFKEAIKKELGDVLWYTSQLATELGLSLEDVAETNIDKLFSRLKRGKIHGDGDSR